MSLFNLRPGNDSSDYNRNVLNYDGYVNEISAQGLDVMGRPIGYGPAPIRSQTRAPKEGNPEDAAKTIPGGPPPVIDGHYPATLPNANADGNATATADKETDSKLKKDSSTLARLANLYKNKKDKQQHLNELQKKWNEVANEMQTLRLEIDRIDREHDRLLEAEVEKALTDN